MMIGLARGLLDVVAGALIGVLFSFTAFLVQFFFMIPFLTWFQPDAHVFLQNVVVFALSEELLRVLIIVVMWKMRWMSWVSCVAFGLFVVALERSAAFLGGHDGRGFFQAVVLTSPNILIHVVGSFLIWCSLVNHRYLLLFFSVFSTAALHVSWNAQVSLYGNYWPLVVITVAAQLSCIASMRWMVRKSELR